MASKKAYLDHLRKVSLFSACSQKDLEKIAKAGDEVVMPAGSLIVDQGQTGREAFVVLEGSVMVKRNGKKVASLGPGTVVGELSLLDHGPRTATVICEIRLHAAAAQPTALHGRARRCAVDGSQAAGVAGRAHSRPRPAVLRLTRSASLVSRQASSGAPARGAARASRRDCDAPSGPAARLPCRTARRPRRPGTT